MTMNFIYIALVISFSLYHFFFFSFSSYVFSKNITNFKLCIISGFINLASWILYANSPFFGKEYVMILVMLTLLFIENKFIFKVNNLFAFFLSLAFTINTFSKRMMLFAAIALLSPETMSFANVSSDLKTNYIVLILSFTLSLSTISLSKKLLTRRYIDIILTDRQNMVFASTLLTIITLSMVIFTFIGIGVSAEIQSFIYMYLTVGATALLGFVIVMIYAYHLADLKLSMETYHRVSSENTKAKKELLELEKTASTDFLTELYTRDLADNLIEAYIKERANFFIIFFDMDNLKTVNDVFGHDEGDFYIKKTSKILTEEFDGDLICRYGGDEFVVVGTYADESQIHLKTMRCYNKVHAIQRTYKKDYETSISYGTVFVPSTNTLSAKRLLALADQRMYTSKKNNKKSRIN